MSWTAGSGDPSTLAGGGPSLAAPGDVLADRYVLEAVVGEGAEVRVFAALDLGQEPPRRVAVKLPAGAGDHGAIRRRLAREAAMAARAHARGAAPGVVGVMGAEVAEHAGMPLLALELVEGPSLREVLGRRGALGVEEALRLGAALGRALDALHAAGVILGDLKPENVVLRGGVEPVIVDLGVARLAGPEGAGRESEGQWLTPAYAAPEQLAGGGASAASDVYALGLVIAEVAGGRAPAPGATPLRGLPGGAARLLRRCLARDPAGRPAAAEVVAALDAARRARTRARRRVAVAAAVAAAIAAAVAAALLPVGGRLRNHAAGERAGAEVRAAQPVTLAGEQHLPRLMVVNERYAWWCDHLGGSLLRVPLEGGAPERLHRHADIIHGLAVAGGELLWVDGQGAVLALRGGEAVELARRPGVAGGIAADARGVAWSDWTHGEVLGLGPGGAGPVRVLARGQDHPEAVALDESHVAWSNHGDGAVRIASREGGEALTIAPAEARPIRVALREGHVYWVNNGDGAVKRAAKGGGGIEVIARSVIGIRGLAVDARHVYWVNPDEGQVLRAPRTPSEGGAPEVLASRQAEPLDVAVDEAAIYWANGAVSGAIMRRAKPE